MAKYYTTYFLKGKYTEILEFPQFYPQSPVL
ncbi:hypothetical protein ABID24_003807 [Blautia caecimuris]|uniref:Uncharacterized protein n=1 Tax=Blautia caecimuris TaxID=1796615 RepID=A0ABV2MAV8_9FIRM